MVIEQSWPISDFFSIAIDRVLGLEDGYVNNPADPGGETKWGISKRSYPHLDIANLTRDEAIAIYRRDFWERIGGDSLRRGVAYQLLDFAVNSGIETAVRMLQRVAGVAEDGHIGPITSAALAAMSEIDVIMLILAERLDFMTRLINWPSAGKGWARRLAADLRYGAQDT